MPLLGASLEELTVWVERQHQPAYRARQLHQWLYLQGVRQFQDITVFPRAWREAAAVNMGRSDGVVRRATPDGTVKYLLGLTDGQVIETVGIPTAGRLTVCVSSQVGCPMACDFCATGKGGFRRNLARHEIVDQVLTVQEDFGRRVSHVVFMGMGEPLLNLDAVLAAVRCLHQDIGISQRSITLSTVGIPGHIHRLAHHHLQVTLAVSLHAPNQSLRQYLIPSGRAYPLEDLLAECREYVEVTGRRVTFEYTVLADVNDRPEHARELAAHLRGFQSHVNLIPYNPIAEADYRRPAAAQIRRFAHILQEAGVAASIRQTRGLEGDAACGQLRAAHRTAG